MISYRKIAMRVLGHPLRVPTNTPRPASHRVTALALTAAMVAGMAAPAYADVYYIGDGNITITKDEKGDVYVKHANSKDPDKGDLDNGEITIKGGKRSEDTPAPGSGSSEGTTPAKSSAKSMSATPISEDSENNDMVYLGDTKGSGEENKNQSGDNTGGEENENQTGGTTGSKENENQTGGTTGSEENENQTGGTTGGEENKNQTNNNTTGGEENKNQPSGTTGGEENENQPSGTTGGEENENQTGDTTGGEENENQPGGTTGGEKNETDFTKKTQTGDSPVLGSQLTYTGPSLNVANANDDDETPNESTTALKTAAENFKNTAKNITSNVIQIINKVKASTLNVTLEDVNLRPTTTPPSASRARATRRSRSRAAIPSPAATDTPASSTTKRARMTTMILLTPAN